MCADIALSNIGQRLKYARQLTGMSRVNFCKKYDLSASTMVKWELGYALLSKKYAIKIADCLKEEGINFDLNWLLEGNGKAAKKISLKQIKENSYTNEHQLIEDELANFCNFHKDALILRIFDDSCLPIYYPGDYIAGVPVEGERMLTLKDEICLTRLENETIIVRKIVGYNANKLTFNLAAVNTHSKVIIPLIKDIKLLNAARISLFRRPL